MREFPLKNSWTTFLDKFNSSNPAILNMLHMTLFQTLLLESISNERDCRPFWTPVYKEISEKLWSPIETDCVDSDLTSSNASSKRPEEKLPFWTTIRTRAPNKSCLKTSCPSSTSIVADKWASEAMTESVVAETMFKAFRLQVYPTQAQKDLIDEWFHTSNYVYNRAVECIRKGDKNNFFCLRDKLVTTTTKKYNSRYIEIGTKIQDLQQKLVQLKKHDHHDGVYNSEEVIKAEIQELKLSLKVEAKTMNTSKNPGVYEWELRTPKDVRAAAVKEACSAYKSGLSNFKNGNIKHFKIKFKKRNSTFRMMQLPKSMIDVRLSDGTVVIAPRFMPGPLKIGKRQINRLRKSATSLNADCDSKLVYQNSKYYLMLPIKTMKEPKQDNEQPNVCGIDPGVRTFMTCFDATGVTEHMYDVSLMQSLRKKIDMLKGYRTRPRQRQERNRYRKRSVRKYERRMGHLVDELHWKTINNILKDYDTIMYGNVKSHDIVKHGCISSINRSMCDLKFFRFKQRLLFKADIQRKRIVSVDEAYTSQTCSACGQMYKPGSSKVYKCAHCGAVMDRDFNGAKNILMKGIVTMGL